MAIKKEKTKLKMNKPRYLDLKVIIIMYVLNKSTRLCLVVMMIKDCKHLIKLKHIHMEQMHSKYVKVIC